MATTEKYKGPFNFDAAKYAAERTLGEVPQIEDMAEDPLISQGRQAVSDMIAGKLPSDVVSELTRRTAETANIGGISGPAARAFQLRDLGVSSLDVMNQGIQFAGQLEELRISRESLNRSTKIEVSKLKEEVRRANDSFALSVVEAGQNSARTSLAALELQSRNRQFRIEAENQLIIANSQKKIGNLQQNISSLSTAFSDFNRQAQLYIDMGV